MRNDLLASKFSGELGDYDIEVHEGNYISEHKLLLKQTESIEEKAMELHQTQLKGFTPEQAETHFLRLASQLDTYAVDPHPVKVSFIFYLCAYLCMLELPRIFPLSLSLYLPLPPSPGRMENEFSV